MHAPDILTYDADIGYTFLPNIRRRIPHESGGYLIRTNSLGFRDTEPSRSPSCTAVVFGDSFTAGDGVSNGKRWTDIIQSKLTNSHLYNFGLPGTGTDQQYLAWCKFHTQVRHDIVVAAILVENIRRNVSAYRPVVDGGGKTYFRAKPYFNLSNETLELLNSPVPQEFIPEQELDGPVDTGGRYPALRKLINQMRMRESMQRLTKFQPVPEYEDPNGHAWLLLRAILSHWAQAISPKKFVIVTIPMYQHVEETANASPYQERFNELAKDIGCKLIDPLPDLLKYSAATRRSFRFKTDVHLTPEGHSALATAIAPKMIEIMGGKHA